MSASLLAYVAVIACLAVYALVRTLLWLSKVRRTQEGELREKNAAGAVFHATGVPAPTDTALERRLGAVQAHCAVHGEFAFCGH